MDVREVKRITRRFLNKELGELLVEVQYSGPYEDEDLDADVVLKEFPDDLAQRSSRIHHHLADKGLFVAMDFKLVDKQSCA